MSHPEPALVTLDQYALVLCATGDGAPLEVALEAARVSPRDWPAAESQIAAWVATSRADPAILPAFDEAMRRAREALNRPVKPLDEDVGLWGRWLRAWSTAMDPIGMLDRSGMDMSDVVRLSTSWGEKMQADRALAERFGAEMQGAAPAPEVRTFESPRIASAKAVVAARKKSESPERQDKASGPSLFGAFPGETPPVIEGAPPAVVPSASTPPEAVLPAANIDAPASPAIPSFMAARAAVSPPPHAPSPFAPPLISPALVGVPAISQHPPGAAPFTPIGAASAPLPFDSSARPEEMPSHGPQQQSGLTNDVDITAVVRKVLAFKNAGAAPPTNVPVTPPANMPVTPSLNAPVTSPANMPVMPPVGKTPLSSSTVFAEAPERPALPFAQESAPGDAEHRAKQMASEQQGPTPERSAARIGETTDVDIAAIARQALAFGAQKRANAPSPPATPAVQARPPVATPPVATPPVATPPVASPLAAPAAAKSPVASPPVPSPAVAPIVPTLTVEQYASLCVDIESSPAHAAEIVRRYGANEAGKRVLDEGWARLFSEQPARRAAFEKAKVAYRTWLSQGGRR